MMTRSGAPGYEASVWAALGAPRNTPAELIDKLNSEINWALTHPKIKARLSNIGAVAIRRSVRLAGLMPGTGESWPLHDFRAVRRPSDSPEPKRLILSDSFAALGAGAAHHA